MINESFELCQKCHFYAFRQNSNGKTEAAATAEASSSHNRSKPLENKRYSRDKPLQKVAPHYVKKVVAEVESSIEKIEVSNFSVMPHGIPILLLLQLTL